MTDIPQAVLSEHFQERMKDRRLVSAIFTTYQFEPSFFEMEVLPVFLDIPLSHAPTIRIVQLEDALRAVPGRIAVYYDQRGLIADGGSSKLDVGRYPIRHPTGIFHPKNVIALVEAIEVDDEGHRARSLLCACSSANLTRAGWWENVECAHIEEIQESEHTLLGEGLARYVDALIQNTMRRAWPSWCAAWSSRPIVWSRPTSRTVETLRSRTSTRTFARRVTMRTDWRALARGPDATLDANGVRVRFPSGRTHHVIGAGWVPKAGLSAEEFQLVLHRVAAESDRLEFLLTGRDIE